MRILSWNAQGDCGGNSQRKAEELQHALDFWQEKEDPIVIACLQEVNGSTGALCEYLCRIGWQVEWASECAKGGGRDQVIAVGPGLTIETTGVIDLSAFEDARTIASTPCRVPFYAVVDVPGYGQIQVVTWHATLGSYQEDDIQGFSTYAVDLYTNNAGAKIIIAADLNYDIGPLNESAMFPGYKGWSNHLDHIIAANVALSDGQNSTEGYSDHEMISVHFE